MILRLALLKEPTVSNIPPLKTKIYRGSQRKLLGAAGLNICLFGEEADNQEAGGPAVHLWRIESQPKATQYRS
jgi:hypothetical protein